MAEFKLPPVSPLGGTTISNFFRVLRGKKIAPRYYSRIPVTIILILFCSLFHWIDRLYFFLNKKRLKIQEPPVFILGHWRSGTTLLHNLMTQDPSSAYVTTYHAVFPNNLKSQWFLRPLMRAFMPEVRPGDNLRLAVHLPQEDEYALSNMTEAAYYHVFYFPRSYKTYYNNFVRFESAQPQEIDRWEKTYKRIIRRAIHDTVGYRPILKNPVNTGRIPRLTHIFPGAKYIFIMRNPITTYLSSKKFFTQLYPTVNLEEFSGEEISRMVLDIYVELLNDYLKDRELIDPAHLIEIRFEEFELNPLEHLERIYRQFDIGDFAKLQPLMRSYLETQKEHKMHGYKISRQELDVVLEKLDFAMKYWDYSIPNDLDIIESIVDQT
ncbi:MAG: sulfotransferase [Cyclobacteriaceae bacterium]|nr:sulfotransferase [Cyclobacteriaceae bacterium]